MITTAVPGNAGELLLVLKPTALHARSTSPTTAYESYETRVELRTSASIRYEPGLPVAVHEYVLVAL